MIFPLSRFNVWASNTVFHSLSVAHIEVAVFTGVKFLVIIPSSKILLDLISKLKNSSFNLFQCYCSSVTKTEGATSPEELRYISWSNIFTEEQILNSRALTIDEWNVIKLIITPQFRFGYRSFFSSFFLFPLFVLNHLRDLSKPVRSKLCNCFSAQICQLGKLTAKIYSSKVYTVLGVEAKYIHVPSKLCCAINYGLSNRNDYFEHLSVYIKEF